MFGDSTFLHILKLAPFLRKPTHFGGSNNMRIMRAFWLPLWGCQIPGSIFRGGVLQRAAPRL